MRNGDARFSASHVKRFPLEGANGFQTATEAANANWPGTFGDRCSRQPEIMRLTGVILFVISQTGDDGMQFFKRNKPSAVTQLVLVNGLSQFIHVLIVRVVRITELTSLTNAFRPLFIPVLTPILKCDGVLHGNLFH
tara:strand:+ start:80 stop:490 length:411 start_codon:yes stop_codon:yes gene_type:complete